MKIPEPVRAEKARLPARQSRTPGRGGIRRRRRRRARSFVRRDQVMAILASESADAAAGGMNLLDLRLGRRLLVQHCVERLRRCAGRVLVAVPQSEQGRMAKLLGDEAEVHAAADSHVDTIRALAASGAAPWILLHDLAWPLASPRLMRNVTLRAFDTGAAAAADVPERPAGRLEAADGFVSLADSPLAVFQSPAAFRRDVLERALSTALPGGPGRALWDLLRHAGVPIAPVRNDDSNRRLSTALDWDILRQALWPALRRNRRLRDN